MRNKRGPLVLRLLFQSHADLLFASQTTMHLAHFIVSRVAVNVVVIVSKHVTMYPLITPRLPSKEACELGGRKRSECKGGEHIRGPSSSLFSSHHFHTHDFFSFSQILIESPLDFSPRTRKVRLLRMKCDSKEDGYSVEYGQELGH